MVPASLRPLGHGARWGRQLCLGHVPSLVSLRACELPNRNFWQGLMAGKGVQKTGS